MNPGEIIKIRKLEYGKYYDKNIITTNSKTVGIPQGNNTSKTIRVKSPNLDIQKSVDKLEYKVRGYYYI